MFARNEGIITASMIFLFTVVIQVFACGATTLGSSSSPISPPVILTSSSPSSIVYSCFLVNDNEASLRSEKEACCKRMAEVWQTDDNGNRENESRAFPSIELRQRCMLEMAQVPPSISSKAGKMDSQHGTANFSWIVSKAFESEEKATPIEQYLWTSTASGNKDQFRRDPVQTVTPYHKTSIQPPTQNSSQSTSIIASRLNCHLGKDGGMHRLFHHGFQPLGSTDGGEDPIYFLYLTIPKGMFIDLDDPIESTMGTIQYTPMEDADGVASDATHSFVMTTTTEPKNGKSSVLSFRARLHAATVCDIEQPSFVSGQHLLVWEIDRIVTASDTMPQLIEFATKLHLRYPHPSSTLEEWIDLPRPLLFAALNSESVVSNDMLEQEHYSSGLDAAERIWVAAGKDEDHNWIMGMTISFCLIGVGIMLRDVSRVSLWDDA